MPTKVSRLSLSPFKKGKKRGKTDCLGSAGARPRKRPRRASEGSGRASPNRPYRGASPPGDTSPDRPRQKRSTSRPAARSRTGPGSALPWRGGRREREGRASERLASSALRSERSGAAPASRARGPLLAPRPPFGPVLEHHSHRPCSQSEGGVVPRALSFVPLRLPPSPGEKGQQAEGWAQNKTGRPPDKARADAGCCRPLISSGRATREREGDEQDEPVEG